MKVSITVEGGKTEIVTYWDFLKDNALKIAPWKLLMVAYCWYVLFKNKQFEIIIDPESHLSHDEQIEAQVEAFRKKIAL